MLLASRLNVVAGAICCMCTIMRRFTGLVILNGAIGLFAGSFIALIPVLLAENLGAQRLPSAFGLTVMFMGISFVIAAPLVGRLTAFHDGFTVNSKAVMLMFLYLLL